ncbi:MAG: T9SS type A sorting domain-containing protein [Lentimicrobium sp.]|nr:T9SS type A sorting domain-containing protein [Lentimicrobium sp.]
MIMGLFHQSENDLNKSDSIALQLKSITSNYFPDSDTFDYIVLSPNPTKDKLNIKTSSALGRSSIILYNTKGFIVYQNSLNLGIECTIDLSSYPSGVYFLNILSGNKTFIKKIIKQ